ncbi:UvrD-helicase domain-containing protein [Pelomonas sp. APW6]|uniref:ATP-dependent DNA helicase Rep n=1 Tax=Roseateles subflavus TaxID=3053353 RepID=A0ABT7LBX7_9BURK|nr:UvrD-helicase domain-containing protein [Pelomonas sp. APW6]MDL5030365.1 UvrD-helicase domain-containing protein [Pelomonas sp. APW6]
MSADPTATLNPAQLEAVHHLHGPCLVVAGAGSGKTRVITTKIARLLQAGYQAKNIAAITFTNKAAQEMRERAKGLVGARAAKDLAISTFHSLGVRLLREEGTRVGLKEQFSILDSDDVLGVLRDAGGTTDANMVKQWQWTISLWKNMGLNAEMALKAAKDEQERIAAVVMGRYQERLAAYQAVDFDDLISLPLKLLTDDAEARGKWQDKLRYVLVDEYQDTNSVQYELLKALVGERGMFTAVGDDDQSIYGWRGATIENLKRLPVDYPNLKIIPLEQNYRSTGAILRAANNVIETNPKLFQKKLWSEYGDGEPIALIEADGEEHEAERAVARIQAIRASLGAKVKFADFAILYRANHQARIFEQALRRAEIPYKVSGGQSFFDKSEIKDLCAWLRLLVNQDDDPAFLRAVTTPKRGIGHTTLGALSQFAGRWKISMYEALFSDSLSTVLNKKAIGSLHEFGRYLNDLEYRARHTEGAEDAKTLMLEWLKDIGYEQHLYDSDENEKAAAARWSNVLDFVDWVAKRCGGQLAQDGGTTFEEPKQTVLQVAQTISVILSLSERGEEQDQVILTTLHASKGLEWPHVFLAGVNEGLLPFKADDEEMTASRLEEERRLMYVGITRARTTLAVSTLRRRKKAREMVMGIPSRFIAEMRLHESGIKEDPREKLKRMREELAAKAAASAAAAAKQNER